MADETLNPKPHAQDLESDDKRRRPQGYGDLSPSDSPQAARLLHLLLDRYETSKAFTAGEATQRRVQIAVNDRLIAGYVSGGMDPDDRLAFHRTLEGWSKRGLIRLEWVRFEVGNLLRRVLLEWDGVKAAYQVLGRVPKLDELSSVRQELLAFRPRLTHPWMQLWLDDVMRSLEERKDLPQMLIPSDGEKRLLLLKTLSGLVEKGDEELSMRLFSKRYLRLSKVFEQQVRTRLTSLLRRYSDPDAVEDEQLLAQVGIEITLEDVAFCGPLRFRIAGQEEFNLARFPTGISLDTEVLHRIELTGLPVTRILSIENKANYRHYIRTEQQANELVVYLGGFHSPGKRRFLRKLRDFAVAATAARIQFHHWSDLDYGGILITQSLRDTVWPEVEPWRMEPEWLRTYAEWVEPFPNEEYRARLEGLLGDPRYRLFRPLIEGLLQVNGVLEQEAFLV